MKYYFATFDGNWAYLTFCLANNTSPSLHFLCVWSLEMNLKLGFLYRDLKLYLFINTSYLMHNKKKCF